ncbi:fimbrial biogenesis usher protein [Enterobacter kobei]|uniref:fimbrial biogenesis usher protein n=1 Tax=Enterobacter kobei TaxID=208224 RepID=UPI003CF64669
MNNQFHMVTKFALSSLALTVSFFCHGKPHFNPAFLRDDTAAVADLSRFESGNNQPAGTYHVDIYINGEYVTTRDVVFKEKPAGSVLAKRAADDTGLEACLTTDSLHQMNVRFSALPALSAYQANQCIPVEKIIPDSVIAFDFESQRMNISIPQIYMDSNVHGYIPPTEWDEGINGGLLNYNLTGSNGYDSSNAFLSLQSGFNLGPWRLRNNSGFSYNKSNDSRTTRWENINAYVERAIIPLKSELIIGDTNSDNMLFDSVGLRGVRMYSVDSMYPDSQRGYAPVVRGIANSRAKVTVRQNGYIVYQMSVSSGPFEITDLNPASSNGDLEVTVEEANGKILKYTIPYSSVPVLQREGRYSYDVAAGTFRSGKSQQNDPFFTQGVVSAGLSHGVTVYGGTQLMQQYQSVAFGVAQNYGVWGASSFDLTHARSELPDGNVYEGQSLRFLYAKSLTNMGTNFQLLGYRYSTHGFYSLDDVVYKTMQGYEYDHPDHAHDAPSLIDYHNLYKSKKGRLQLNISQQLGMGSVYLTGSQQTYWNTSDKDTWYQLGYSGRLGRVGYNFSLAYNRNSGRDEAERNVSFMVSVPLSIFENQNSIPGIAGSTYSTTRYSNSTSGSSSIQTGISGTLLKERNLAYSLYEGHSGRYGNTGSANVQYNSQYANVGIGYNYDNTGHQWSYQLAGGMVAHANGVTLSQPLGNTNVLIKAPGAKSVSVENSTGIRTDWRGYAVVPFATVYRRNRIALNTNTMDEHIDLDENVRNVVPTEGAIVRAEFNSHVGIRALFSLKSLSGVIPFGATVTEKSSGVTGIVGDNGQVYMSGLPVSGTLESKWGNRSGQSCVIPYRFDARETEMSVSQMNLTCHS